MNTLLLICAESKVQVSRQFINAAIDANLADQVVATSFDKLKESVRTSEGKRSNRRLSRTNILARCNARKLVATHQIPTK